MNSEQIDLLKLYKKVYPNETAENLLQTLQSDIKKGIEKELQTAIKNGLHNKIRSKISRNTDINEIESAVNNATQQTLLESNKIQYDINQIMQVVVYDIYKKLTVGESELDINEIRRVYTRIDSVAEIKDWLKKSFKSKIGVYRCKCVVQVNIVNDVQIKTMYEIILNAITKNLDKNNHFLLISPVNKKMYEIIIFTDLPEDKFREELSGIKLFKGKIVTKTDFDGIEQVLFPGGAKCKIIY